MDTTNEQIASSMMSTLSSPKAEVGGGLLSFLHSLSNIQLGLTLLLVGLACSTIIPYSIRRFAKLEPSEGFAKGAEESFKVIISLTLLLMAFCLVRTQGDHRSVDDLVSREASVIIKLDRAYHSFGGEEGDILQKNLMDYATDLVIKEWPLLPRGGRSDTASDQLTLLSLRSKSLDPKTAPQQIARAEILAAFTQLSDLREARISASKLELPTYLWEAISTALAFLTFLGWFQSPLKKAIPYVGGVTCGLMLLLSVLVATAGIFEGENAVNSTPIQGAIQLMVNNKARGNPFPVTEQSDPASKKGGK